MAPKRQLMEERKYILFYKNMDFGKSTESGRTFCAFCHFKEWPFLGGACYNRLKR